MTFSMSSPSNGSTLNTPSGSESPESKIARLEEKIEFERNENKKKEDLAQKLKKETKISPES
eukprot:TCALIF_03919-PA protein Name:"Protein of unknown function" AED:0.17 eAED:0.17 QI:0/0/0.5/0.5/1/1/2/205/61